MQSDSKMAPEGLKVLWIETKQNAPHVRCTVMYEYNRLCCLWVCVHVGPGELRGCCFSSHWLTSRLWQRLQAADIYTSSELILPLSSAVFRKCLISQSMNHNTPFLSFSCTCLHAARWIPHESQPVMVSEVWSTDADGCWGIERHVSINSVWSVLCQ